MTTTPAIAVHGLGRRFGDRWALRDVTLAVQPGEVLTVVGESGCGKSTLLRLVCGLDEPSEGRVELAGSVVADAAAPAGFVPPHRRRVGLVPQDVALFPNRTVEANVAFGLSDRPRSERRRRVAELLDLVRIAPLAARYPHELSGGEQQRVAIARAMAPDPVAVCLDEPFSALDPHLRRAVGDEVVALLRSLGATAVLVTHDQDEALSLGDHVAVLEAGRLAWTGPVDEALDQVSSPYAARFLGVGEVLRGHGDGTTVATALGPVPAHRSGPASVLARPSQVCLAADGADGVVARRRNSRFGELVEVELTSGERVVLWADGPTAVGQPVRVAWRPGARPAVFPG